MANLIIFNSGTMWSLASAAIATLKYGDSTDDVFLDVKGLDNAGIDSAIAALDADTYDEVIIMVTAASDGSEATITTDQMDVLQDCLINANLGTIVGTGYENADIHTSNTIGLTGTTWTVNEHAGRFVKITGGTGVNQIARILSNTATTLTIEGEFATEADDDSDFEIWEDLMITPLFFESGDKFPPAYAWEYIFPNNTAKPLVLKYLSDPAFSECYGQATSVAAGSLTHTGAFAGKTLDDYYVYIWDSTLLGKYQVAQIASNTNDALTLTANWEHTPTGTVLYKVVKNFEEVLCDAYVTLYALTYLFDLTDSSVLYDWTKLLGIRGSAHIELFPSLPPVTDMDFLVNTVLVKGKTMVDYIRESDWR